MKISKNEKMKILNNNMDDYYDEKKISKIRVFPFLVSELGLFMIIFFIVILFFFNPQYHSAKIFKSKKSKDIFNTNYIPKILFHLTDTHTNTNHGSSLKKNGSIIFLNSFIKYEPDLILSTGDIADNFEDSTHFIKVGALCQKDWDVYNETIRKLISKFPVVDVSGNHDLYTVESATSEHNLFLDYSFMFNRENVKNEDDFIIKKVKMMDLTFILFNDYRFPVPPPPYGIDVHTNKHQLDLLEDMIDNLEEDECYILSHYNVDRAWLIKSSKGHTFQEIVSNKKVAGIFTGHVHPKTVNIIHHGSEGGLEYCSSSPFNNKRAGLITIDNDNLIYNDVHIPSPDKRPLFFMTYPVPNEQISSHHIFNLNYFEIRVLSYITDKNVTLKVEGDVKGELKYVMTLNNGAILYSLPINLPNGSYKIHVYDEQKKLCDISRNFTIGDTYKGQKEKAIHNPRAFFILRFSAIPIIIFLFIIITPYNNKINFKMVENIENYIERRKNIEMNTFLLYLWIILLSPLLLRNRFLKLNKFCRYSIFIISLYPIFLPIHIFNRMHGTIGFAFNVFIVIGSYIQYEHWAMEITYSFYLFIILPSVFYLTGIKYYSEFRKKIKIIYYINIIFNLIFLLEGLSINFLILAQSTSFGYIFIGPYFILLVLVKIIIHKFSYLQKPIKKEQEEEELIDK